MSARLIAEIGADVSGFESGLRRADTAANKFMHGVSSKMSKAFGVGFLAGALFQLPTKLVEQAEEIADGAKKLGTTTDEYQLLMAAAKDAGQEIGEFVKKNAEQGTMLDTLIPKLEKYRNEIKLTKNEISDWKELKQGAGAFGKGLLGPLGTAGRIGGKGLLSLLDVAGAGISALMEPFGRTLLPGTTSSDLLYSAGARFGLVPKDEGSSPLRMPTAKGQTAALAQLKEQLKVLEGRESALKSEGSLKTSLWNPALTERQQAGAYVMRGGIAVTEQEKTNSILSDVRKEITETKEQIRKLVDQGG
jgi:hypothetical protein